MDVNEELKNFIEKHKNQIENKQIQSLLYDIGWERIDNIVRVEFIKLLDKYQNTYTPSGYIICAMIDCKSNDVYNEVSYINSKGEIEYARFPLWSTFDLYEFESYEDAEDYIKKSGEELIRNVLHAMSYDFNSFKSYLKFYVLGVD